VKLYATPIKLADAQAYIAKHHRHHNPSIRSVFNIAVCDETGKIRGVAMVGWPVARGLADGFTLEVNRVATDGVRNGCSFLYGMARRIAFDMGYRRLVTYTLPVEGGASLRASNWRPDGETIGRSWSCPSRPRPNAVNLGNKHRWAVENKKAFQGEVFIELDEDDSQVSLFGELP